MSVSYVGHVPYHASVCLLEARADAWGHGSQMLNDLIAVLHSACLAARYHPGHCDAKQRLVGLLLQLSLGATGLSLFYELISGI